ncbi:MAG TPA: LTA synthase family protein [Geopsychrobacteraceae bacterium]|nr:LTA synthase family protein [Geopsychrobacteraceae bacterium]
MFRLFGPSNPPAQPGDDINKWSIRLGPLRPILTFIGLSLLLLGLSRIGLIVWQWSRVAEVDGLWSVLGFGLRMDMVLISYFLMPLALGMFLLPPFLLRTLVWRWICTLWLTLSLTVLVFMETATPPFIQQYDVRPNRVFVEYLNHPKEVGMTLWGGYKIELLISLVVLLMIVGVGKRLFAPASLQSQGWSWRKRLLVFPLIACLLFLFARSSFEHRPANASTAAFSSDHLVNELGISSAYSVLFAIYRLKDEQDAIKIYPHMASDEVVQRIRREMMLDPADFVSDKIPTLHLQRPTITRQKPMNLVIILEESLGAQYVGALGGKPYTPELEKLSKQGLWFSHLYATGTRSIRGIEAVVTGFMPTPARSVVKLGLAQQGFFTLARILKNAGYSTEFIYGGESHFDNMRGFFLANGFERIIDQNDFDDDIFRATWGVADGDLMRRADEEFRQHGDEPFFALVFTSSNHPPYEIPEGMAKTGSDEKPFVSAIRYADHSLGAFFKLAQASPYWDNTLFLVVADHDDVVSGPSLIPIRHFQIPGLILGGKVEPREDSKVASQIDLPPTLLSMMGLESEHPMPGHDLLQLPEDYPGRAIMQYGMTHAYMRGDQVVVHTQDKAGEQFTYHDEILDPTESPDSELIKDALATALWPSLAYQEQKYILADMSTAKTKASHGMSAVAEAVQRAN